MPGNGDQGDEVLEGLGQLGTPPSGDFDVDPEEGPGGGDLPLPAGPGAWTEDDQDEPDERDEKAGRLAPYWAQAMVMRIPISPAMMLRAYAYWAGQGKDWTQVTSQDLYYYLELATFQHAESDLQRKEQDRLYSHPMLHLQATRRMINAEVAAQRKKIAEGSARGEREAILRRIATAKTIEEALQAIKEMDQIGS